MIRIGHGYDSHRYKDGEYFLSNTWKENGEIIIKDGNGLLTEWYENGQKSYEGTFKDGEQQGLHTSWYENGQKENEGILKDGEVIKLIGKWNWDGSVRYD